MHMLTEVEINQIRYNELSDPFDVLGMHCSSAGLCVRVWRPGAQSIAIIDRTTHKKVDTLECSHPDGIFEKVWPKRKKIFSYLLETTYPDNVVVTLADPYSFLPVMTEEARYLFNEGNYERVYDDLGSHVRTLDSVEGVVFAVWAPSAKRVSVVGNFNTWDGRRHPMRKLGASGVWELFIPGLTEGAVYKYEIKKHDRDHLILKTDPYGYCQEAPTNHGSIVYNLDAYVWEDSEWLARRAKTDRLNCPISIYEVHLGSWRKTGPDIHGDWLSYRELAHQLAEYVLEMGYTHIELLPIQDHPYVPSWGYQVGGFYAPNHRFGSPAEFQYFVDYMHNQGISVIIDWVPAHFPKDTFGLAQFDGTNLYEHADPREGEHKDWGTLIFNVGRNEVRNFLVANALFWCEKFHIDGIRVDAVASMLYRNYSRNDGEWIPNIHGGAENLEAVHFLQTMNRLVHERFPGAITIAEESTSWPMVSRPTYLGGLGFTFKWNMGWMHDMLSYFSKDPVYRVYHQNQITFGLWYAFTENFMLVISHDEVVHGKKSLLEKMPGDPWRKFANNRAFFGFMFGHPGKKLMFMGTEFGSHWEWDAQQSITWNVLAHDDDAFHHSGLQAYVADCNKMYKQESALWEKDFDNSGFSWIDFSDAANSIIAFTRTGNDWHNMLLFVCNFTPNPRHNYRVGVPHGGFYEEILNSDASIYGGAGYGNLGGKHADGIPTHGQSHSLDLTIPPLSVMVLKWKR